MADSSKTCGTCWHFTFLKGTCDWYCRKLREVIIEWPNNCELWVDRYSKTLSDKKE